MSEKITKAEAQYRLGTQKRRCSMCTMFEEALVANTPSSCTKLRGSIDPIYVCDYFERKDG